jgi:hypothetical protein
MTDSTELANLLLRIHQFITLAQTQSTLSQEHILEGELILFDIEYLLCNVKDQEITLIHQSKQTINEIISEDEYRKDLLEDERQVEQCYKRLMKNSK